MGKRNRMAALRRAAGYQKVSCLWRTGLMPSAGHGAGVTGVTDSTLVSLRAFAASLLGAKGRAHVTAYLCTHRDAAFDPVVDATVQIVKRYCCWVWDQRVSDSDMRKAWEAATKIWRSDLTVRQSEVPSAPCG